MRNSTGEGQLSTLFLIADAIYESYDCSEYVEFCRL
jgi:hypothetical protein